MAGMQLKFPSTPLIFQMIEKDYGKCESLDDFVRFAHFLVSKEEQMNHIENKDALKSTYCAIFAEITGKSWESAITNLIPNEKTET